MSWKVKQKKGRQNMEFIRISLLRRFYRKKAESDQEKFCLSRYNAREVNDRVYLAMNRLGKSRCDVAEFFGMDPSIPLSMQPPELIPRMTMETMAKMSIFLGVSVRWMLEGEAENDVDVFVTPPVASAGSATGVQGSAVGQGNANSTIVVKNIHGDDLTEIEKEIVSTFRKLGTREKASILSYIFALEKETEGVVKP